MPKANQISTGTGIELLTMTLIGRENAVSSNGVTLDYDMLLEVIRLASNDAREELRIHLHERIQWQTGPNRADAERMLRKAEYLAKITEIMWVLQSMDQDEDGRWPEQKWLGFQLTRREVDDTPSLEPEKSDAALQTIMATLPSITIEDSPAPKESDGKHCSTCGSSEHNKQTCPVVDKSKQYTCSNCGLPDHNKRTCTQQKAKHARRKPKGKTQRKPSRWNRFVADKPILFKSGPRKGRLNWSATAKAYRAFQAQD